MALTMGVDPVRFPLVATPKRKQPEHKNARGPDPDTATQSDTNMYVTSVPAGEAAGTLAAHIFVSGYYFEHIGYKYVITCLVTRL